MTAERRELPIAVFDSGVGGLTVLHECLVSLPAEDFLYLGDDARFPYGTKTARVSCASACGATSRFLLDRGAKLLVVACNSATRRGRGRRARDRAAEHGVEVVTVIEPEAEIAAAISDSGRVGVLATPATVESGAYRLALARPAPRARRDRGRGAGPRADHPARVSVRRGGDRDGALLLRAASRRGVDTLILGCTHYPLVAPMLQRILGRDVRLVTAGHALAAAAQRMLEARGAGDRPTAGRATTASSARATSSRSASSARGSCRCRSARSSTWTSRDAGLPLDRS